VGSKAKKPVLVPKTEAAPRGGAGYLKVSSSLAASIVFIMPLLVVYEVGIWRMRGASGETGVVVEEPVAPEAGTRALRANPLAGDRNAIAALTKGILFFLGPRAMLAFNALVAGALVWALVLLMRRQSLRLTVFPLMLAESVVYAVVVMLTVNFVLKWELSVPGAPGDFAGLWDKGVAAAGAGVYEELVFRGALLGGLYFVALDVLRMKRPIAVIASLATASAIFSLAHFITPGQVDDWGAFRFRFAAGMVLSVVYMARGLGIAAWAHAIYNAWVFCSVAGA